MEKWFINTLKKVMAHNDYEEYWLTAKECDKVGKWTPCDLIAREYLNNGCGSAKGFLGITPNTCLKAYKYMCEIKKELIDSDYISIDAWNNSSFMLWTDYNFDR